MKIYKISKFLLLILCLTFTLSLASCDTSRDSKLEALIISSENDVTSIKIEETLSLTVKKVPETAVVGRITWESSDEDIAKVSKTGIVTAINSGVVTITASYLDVTGEIEITVIEQAEPIDNLFPEVETHKILTEYNEITSRNETYIYFGEYPQSVVNNQKLVTALDKASRIDGTDIVEYKGHRYLAVTIENKYASYRDWKISDERYPYYTGFEIGKTEYFRIEPIKWKVISYDTLTQNAMLMAMDILDCKPFLNEIGDNYRVINGQTVYNTNYEYSSIRNWLNYDFFNTAFSKFEQSVIAETLLVNEPDDPIYVSKYPTNDTIDKIYLPSYTDITKAEYGFDPFGYYSVTRQAKNSDYARSQGATVTTIGNPPRNNGLYSLRFGLNSLKDYVAIVSYEGYVSNANGSTSSDGSDEKCFYVDAPSLGVRPCCNIDLNKFSTN